MKTILSLIVLIYLSSFKIAYADPKNPTLEWLSIQNVNSLTQKYGYTLKFITMTNENDEQYTQYHLTRSKTDRNDGKFIVVTCTYRGITLGHHCFLP